MGSSITVVGWKPLGLEPVRQEWLPGARELCGGQKHLLAGTPRPGGRPRPARAFPGVPITSLPLLLPKPGFGKQRGRK